MAASGRPLLVSEELAERLERVAEEMDVSSAALADEALDRYLALVENDLAGIRRGLADADGGRTASHEAVRNWLLSWGSDEETAPPRCS